MRAILSHCRIGYQMLMPGLIGIVGMVSVAGINWWSASEIDRIDGSAALIRNASGLEYRMRIALLQARRFEKDFLLRPDDRLPERHAEAIAEAESAMNALIEPLAEHPRQLDQLRAIRGAVGSYVEAFDTLQSDIQVLGMNEDQGLQGLLRGAVHDVEERLQVFDVPAATIAMLMMRRHEKDFMLRLDAKYGDQLAQRLPEFTAALDGSGIPPDVRGELARRMRVYQETFARFMRGTLMRTKSTGELNPLYDGLERQLQALDQGFTELATAAQQEAAAQVEHAHTLMLAAASRVLSPT